MAKNFYFVVQSWMLEEMELKLAEAAVYAYIHGLTNSDELGKLANMETGTGQTYRRTGHFEEIKKGQAPNRHVRDANDMRTG